MTADGVSLNPGLFADDGGLLDMPMEDVVTLFRDKERRRNKDAKDDENQQEALIGSRVVPVGLVMSLDSRSRSLDISRGLLTRCLSHQIMAWYGSMPRLKELTELFYISFDAADDYGYPDLCEGMREIGYSFVHVSPKSVSFRTINWVKNGLQTISYPLGLTVCTLFTIGVCRSLITTGSGHSAGTIEKYLTAEVERFNQHVEERFIKVFGFNDLVRRRALSEGRNKSDNMITR